LVLRPSTNAPFPFTERQCACLLILGGRLHAMASPMQQLALSTAESAPHSVLAISSQLRTRPAFAASK
jgi:hypothetical protein